MLNRLTIAALLKTVVLATASFLVLVFALNAWDCGQRLKSTNRIAVIADASASLFMAMNNLRSDRSTTSRLLNSDSPVDSEIDKYLRNIRDTEMPAMGNALGLLPSIEFTERAALVPELDDYLRPGEAVERFARVPQARVVGVDRAKHLWVGETYVRIVLNEIVRLLNPAAWPLPAEWKDST